jgi:hypothetical protein
MPHWTGRVGQSVQVSDAPSTWSLDEQLAYLRGLTAGLEHDIRLALEPEFSVEWYLGDDGEWWYGCWGSAARFAEPSEVEPSTSSLDHEEQILLVAQNLADNMWPDEWTDPWPLCPTHRDHPLGPALERDRASWVCRRDHRIAIPIGRLGEPPLGSA